MPATPLITAAHAYPAMERLVLQAERSVWMAFRIFDPTTKLRSQDCAKLRLTTWHDLVAHALERGLTFHIRLADFDPAGSPSLHRTCWEAAAALGDIGARFPKQLHVLPAFHPHQVGWLPRLVFWPPVRKRLVDAMKTSAGNNEPPDFLKLRETGVPLWPPHAIRPATHHEKVMVADGTRAILGGIDIDDRRFDTPQHDKPADKTWHDVSLLVEGEDATSAIADLRAHLAQSWHLSERADDKEPFDFEATEETAPAEGKPTLRFLRTFSVEREGLTAVAPKTTSSAIEDETLVLIDGAKELLYIESQFFRSETIAGKLTETLRANRDLNIMMVLPAAPEDIAFEGNTGPDARHGEWLQSRCIDLVRRIGGPRVLIASPVGASSPTPDAQSADESRDQVHDRWPIYVHSKVTIADGARAIVSSANLNGRSMRWDTEAGVLWDDPDAVRAFQDELLGKHLRPDTPLPRDTSPLEWMHHFRNAMRRSNDAPLAPYPHQRARRFAAPRFYVPDDIV